MKAQFRFLQTKLCGNGFYESSGAGYMTEYAMNCLRGEEVYVVVLDVPDELCIARMDPHKYDGVPFPFKDTGGENFIRSVGITLDSHRFEEMCAEFAVLRIDGTLPLGEQIAAAEKFAGI